MRGLLLSILLILGLSAASAQTPPTSSEVASFPQLHAAAHNGDIETIGRLISNGINVEELDSRSRTALHVAVFASHEDIVVQLAKAGANLNALEYQQYDPVTIAAVANDLDMLRLLLELGASASNVTSPYDGTALIAAAHLGHHEVVKMLIDAGAPLDHVNNLKWTALIESVVLGDGGENHIKTAKRLVEAGADKAIGDRDGITPLQHAIQRDYKGMVEVLSK